MKTFDKLYIDGAWVEPAGNETLEVIDSTSEEVFATIPAGTPADIDRAVAAAKAAFPGWSETTGARARQAAAARGRGARGAARRDRRGDDPRGRHAEAALGRDPGGHRHLRLLATRRSSRPPIEFEDDSATALVVKEPIGVVGCITPWNYPLNQIAAKVAYALAAGCTVVLKPSEVAPVNAFILAEIIDDLGFPPGVFNLVTGVGPVVGEAIAAHPDVDMVSFTGSTRAGRRVSELAAPSIKRVALELGGKSPNVLLDDADFAAMVPAGVGAAYMNSGQTCSALDAHDRAAVAAGRGRGARQAGGRGLRGGRSRSRTAPRLGPLVSGVQRERVRGYIQKGIDEGADPRDRRCRRTRRTRPGLLRAADGVLQRHDRQPRAGTRTSASGTQAGKTAAPPRRECRKAHSGR